MTEQEYPRFTSEAELAHLTMVQRAMVFAEGNPALATMFGFWFVATSCTLPLNYVSDQVRFVLLVIALVCFVTSGTIMWIVLKKTSLEKDQLYSERNFLRKLGVKKPMKFIREHPLHLAAYHELKEDLKNTPVRLAGSFHRICIPAMLVFTGPERHLCGPLILSIVNERKITTADGIAAALEAMEQPSATLNEGSL